KISLPTYPFEHERFWVDSETTQVSAIPAKSATIDNLASGRLELMCHQLQASGIIAEQEAPLTQRILDAVYRQHEDEQAAAAVEKCVYEVQWRPLATQPASDVQVKPGCWLLLADSSALADGLRLELEGLGQRCDLLHISNVDLTAPQPFLENLRAHTEPLAGVIHLWSLDLPAFDADASLPVMAPTTLWSVTALVQALTKLGKSAPIHLVTRAAVAVRAGDAVDPVQTPLWGLGKVLRLEMPLFGGNIVDLPADFAATKPEVSRLVAQLLSSASEDQVALRDEKWYVPRLLRSEPTNDALPVQPQASYLITGGLGALGLQVAGWLARRGARNLVLIGRRVPSEQAAAVIQQLQEKWHCRVQVAQVDLKEADQVARLLAELADQMPPVKGLIHAAGIGNQTAISSLSPTELEQTLAAKVQGAWNLHRFTQHVELDFFISFSSIASIWGGRGQGAYAAANAFLDGLAHLQCSQGRPGLSLNWGPWSGGGMADGAAQEWLAQNGVRTLTPARALAALDHAGPSATQRVVADVDWPLFLAIYQARGERPFLREIQAKTNSTFSTSSNAVLGTLLASSPAGQHRRLIQERLQQVAGQVMRLPSEQVDPRLGFFEMGMDSQMAVELRRRLEADLGRALPATLAFDRPRIVDLVDFILADDEQHTDGKMSRSTGPSTLIQPGQHETERAASSPATTGEAIAIVGLACRMPGAGNPAAYWKLLHDGVDAIREVPPSRWDIDAYFDPDPDAPGKMYCRHGGFLEDIDGFDPHFFGIAPREAIAMDPQQRLLLELAWEALEHAGLLAPTRLERSRTGVFVGVGANEYASLATSNPAAIGPYFGTGNALNVIAGRVAYVLGLEGPALVVDTACSSSLVAVHQACQALRAGECDLALAGGVNLMLNPAGM
ncbi:MAG: SDR family NAD(P)-dependent oxidoreductase, partial [Gemmataceae bacterium]